MTTVEQLRNPQQYSHLTKMQQPETAKNIHMYLNGDPYFAGRKFVLNRRYITDFNGFLNQVTLGINAPFGAVRNVYTPSGGHRVNDLAQIQTGMNLVAGGVERFRKLDYREIGLKKRQQKPRRNFLDVRRNQQTLNVEARWRNYVKDPCQIYVYANGDINAPAIRLLLIPRCMKTWDLVLREVTEKLCNRTGYAVRKLYDMKYHLLLDPSELENGQYYIAVGTERIKRYPYGEITAANKLNLSFLKKSNQPLPLLKKVPKPRPPPKDDKEQTYAKMHVHKKHMKEQEQTTVMGASAATGYRPLRMKIPEPTEKQSSGTPTREADSVFHAKPVKVKRSGGKVAHVPQDVHPPQDGNKGIFKAESGLFKAEEVKEADNIIVDRPLDEVAADVIEEENIEVRLPKKNVSDYDNGNHIEEHNSTNDLRNHSKSQSEEDEASLTDTIFESNKEQAKTADETDDGNTNQSSNLQMKDDNKSEVSLHSTPASPLLSEHDVEGGDKKSLTGASQTSVNEINTVEVISVKNEEMDEEKVEDQSDDILNEEKDVANENVTTVNAPAENENTEYTQSTQETTSSPNPTEEDDDAKELGIVTEQSPVDDAVLDNGEDDAENRTLTPSNELTETAKSTIDTNTNDTDGKSIDDKNDQEQVKYDEVPVDVQEETKEDTNENVVTSPSPQPSHVSESSNDRVIDEIHQEAEVQKNSDVDVPNGTVTTASDVQQ